MERNEPSYAFRIVLVIILTVAIFATIIVKKNREFTEKHNVDTVKEKINLIYRGIYFQLLLTRTLDQESRKAFYDQILHEIQIVEQLFPGNPLVEIQNLILHEHLKKQNHIRTEYELTEKTREHPEYREYVHALIQIYRHRAGEGVLHILESDPHKIPLNKIAKLDLYSQISEEKEREYLEKLEKEIYPLQMTVTILTAGFFISSLIGMYLLVRFFSKPNPEIYGTLIRSLPQEKSWVFFETAIIYMFLYVSLQYFLLEILHPYIQSHILQFQIAYTLLIFLVTMVYLKNELGFKFFRFLLWTRMYSSKELDAYIQNQEPERQDSTEMLKTLEKITEEKKIPSLSILHEIFAGVAGFLVIFPVGFSVLIVSFVLSGNPAPVEEIHPVSYLYPENKWEVILLALFLAPVIEEIIFRNLIYGFFRYKFSVIISALASSFIFAGLHPQGPVAFPYLVTVGTGLALLREFRPGIIAPAVTHFFINGFALLLTDMFYRFQNF